MKKWGLGIGDWGLGVWGVGVGGEDPTHKNQQQKKKTKQGEI